MLNAIMLSTINYKLNIVMLGVISECRYSECYGQIFQQIQCEDVWFLRQIRQIVARIKADRKNAESGTESGQTTDNEIAAEMAQRQRMIESQVRGIGTDVGIVSRYNKPIS